MTHLSLPPSQPAVSDGEIGPSVTIVRERLLRPAIESSLVFLQVDGESLTKVSTALTRR